jgi:ABC-type Mn2+/Zn2+ transport system permease subunit
MGRLRPERQRCQCRSGQPAVVTTTPQVAVRRLSFVSAALTRTVFPGVVVGFLAGGLTALLFGRILTVTPPQLAETAALVVVVLVVLGLAARALLFRAFEPAGPARPASTPAPGTWCCC